MIIDAKNMPYAELNKMIRDSDEQKFTLENVLGQRYIGAGLSGKEILIKGTPGNALGAYLNGAKISVHGNAQDATGDTMNDGKVQTSFTLPVMDDERGEEAARQIAKKIEDTLDYPGQIKVNVIRESRAVEYAK